MFEKSLRSNYNRELDQQMLQNSPLQKLKQRYLSRDNEKQKTALTQRRSEPVDMKKSFDKKTLQKFLTRATGPSENYF